MPRNSNAYSAKRKALKNKALDRSATSNDIKIAETLTPQMPRKCPANILPKTRAKKLAAIETRARRKKLETWLKVDLYKMIEQRRYCERYRLEGFEREDFEAVVTRLRWRDPLIGRKIDLVNFIDRNSVTVWFWVGAYYG